MIEGQHVRLRTLERSDLPVLHRWMNDREVMTWGRFSPDHMTSLAALEKEYEKELTGEESNRTTFVIERTDGGKPIGWCSLHTWDRKHVSVDVGIVLGEKGLWGQGLGSEAVGLLLELVFQQQGWHHAELYTLVENQRAVRSAEKCGFRRVGVHREATYFDGRYHDLLIMEQLKSEWDARNRAASTRSRRTGSRAAGSGAAYSPKSRA